VDRIKEMKLIALFGFVAIAAAQPVPKELEGRWRTAQVSKEGMGAIYSFGSGGVVGVSMGPLAPGRYREEGQDVLLPPLVVGGPPNRMQMDFSTPGLLRLQQGGRTLVELARAGGMKKGGGRLVGQWNAMQDFKGKKCPTLYFFYPDGRCLFLMAVESVQAKFSISEGRMTIRFPDGKKAEGPYSRTGTKLTIPSLREGASTVLEAY
jgi:hypothetical protein